MKASCNMGNHAYGHRLDDLQAVKVFKSIDHYTGYHFK